MIVAAGLDKTMDVSVSEFLDEAMDMHRKVLLKVCLPQIMSDHNQVVTYKVSMDMGKNGMAALNASFCLFSHLD